VTWASPTCLVVLFYSDRTHRLDSNVLPPPGVYGRKPNTEAFTVNGRYALFRERAIYQTSEPANTHKTPQTLWWYVMLLCCRIGLASRYLGTQARNSQRRRNVLQEMRTYEDTVAFIFDHH